MPEAPEFVTVAEASERWGVPARRVRHVLERSAKRGGNAPQTFQKTFRTKTGERSAVAYPVAWLGALLEADTSQAETLQPSEGKRSANEAKRGAEPFQQSAPERSEGDDGSNHPGDWRARALVAEARAELLERELGDWKAQAQDLTQALQRAQDEARAARLIGGRGPMKIEASGTGQELRSGTPDGSQSSPSVSSGGITTPSSPEEPRRGLLSFLRRWW